MEHKHNESQMWSIPDTREKKYWHDLIGILNESTFYARKNKMAIELMTNNKFRKK